MASWPRDGRQEQPSSRAAEHLPPLARHRHVLCGLKEGDGTAESDGAAPQDGRGPRHSGDSSLCDGALSPPPPPPLPSLYLSPSSFPLNNRRADTWRQWLCNARSDGLHPAACPDYQGRADTVIKTSAGWSFQLSGFFSQRCLLTACMTNQLFRTKSHIPDELMREKNTAD